MRTVLTVLLLSLYTADHSHVEAFCPGVVSSSRHHFSSQKLSPWRRPRAVKWDLAQRRQSRSNVQAVKMGMREWLEARGVHGGSIGALPFGKNDVLLPGETKQLHLDEARFLALFEQAIKDHGSCFVHMSFAAQQEITEIAAIGTIVEIVEWRRQDVGVFVRVRAVGRVAVEAIEDFTVMGSSIASMGPYFVVKARDVNDEPCDEEAVETLMAEVRALHAECVDLQRKLDKGTIMLRTSDDFEWGHEKADKTSMFKTDLDEQLLMHKDIIEGGTSMLEHELFSFLASTGFDDLSRLAAVDMMDTAKRLEASKELMAEQKKILQAKSALDARKLD